MILALETLLDWDPIVKERGGFWEWHSGNIHWRSGVDREPVLGQMGTGHAEEIAAVIDEAGFSAIAFHRGARRDWLSACRRCLWDCSNARNSRPTHMSCIGWIYESCTDVWHRRLLEKSPWIQKARCLVQSWCQWASHLKWRTTTSAEHTFKEPRGNSFTSDQSCFQHNAELRKTNVALCRGKHNATLLYNPNQVLRMAMWGDLECLLDNDEFKHTDIQIQRRRARHGITLGFKDSHVRNLVTDQTNMRRKTEFDSERDGCNTCEFGGSRQVGFCWSSKTFGQRSSQWASLVNSYLSPKKLTVRDSIMQNGNNTSKSEVSIQSKTALNAGEMETLVTDQLEAVQQKELRDTREFLGTGTSSRRRCQYEEGKEARECYNNTKNKANRCFCTTIFLKSKDWYSTGHGSHTPLPDDGDKPMMDLA